MVNQYVRRKLIREYTNVLAVVAYLLISNRLLEAADALGGLEKRVRREASKGKAVESG